MYIIYVCMYVCMYMYVYILTHTQPRGHVYLHGIYTQTVRHTHTHTQVENIFNGMDMNSDGEIQVFLPTLWRIAF